MSRRFALFGSSCLVLLAVPVAASAQLFVCDINPDGSQLCGTTTPCTARRECIASTGSDDWFCVQVGTDPAAPQCAPSCGTFFTCTSDDDCPMLRGTPGVCASVSAAVVDVGTPVPDRVCTYRPSVTARNARLAYCTDVGLHIPGARFAECQTLPRRAGDPPVFTPDYFAGDCDGDGCPNGADNDPCAAPSVGTACTATATFDSPFCPPPPPLACAPNAAGGWDCGDARPCAPTATAPACMFGACERSWAEDGPRCRPPCSTLFRCSTSVPTGGVGVEPACPAWAGEVGVCRPTSGFGFAPIRGYDGVCDYASFGGPSCPPSTVPMTECFADPDGAPTADFFTGDCDGDGFANGCDTTHCAVGGSTTTCFAPPGAGCGAVPPDVDAGAGVADTGAIDGGRPGPDAFVGLDSGAPPVDSGVAPTDSGARDASGRDGGPPRDAGGIAVDANGNDASGGAFTGGGGCRCSAAGADHGGLGALLATAVAVSLARRRKLKRAASRTAA